MANVELSVSLNAAMKPVSTPTASAVTLPSPLIKVSSLWMEVTKADGSSSVSAASIFSATLNTGEETSAKECPWDDPIALVCDEEGLLKHAAFNRLIAPEVAIFSSFFICGLGEEDFMDLSGEMITKYAQLLHAPEILIRTGRGCVPIQLTNIHGSDGNVSISSRSAL